MPDSESYPVFFCPKTNLGREMRKYFLMSLGVLLLANVTASAQRKKGKGKGKGSVHKSAAAHKSGKEEKAYAGPKLVFKDGDTHNFGRVAAGKVASYEFSFVNTGDQPLIIQNVAAPMGCTTPTWTRHPIVPGGRGTVTVGYSSAKQGPFSKEVLIQCNATDKQHTVCIKGMVTDGAGEPEKKKG